MFKTVKSKIIAIAFVMLLTLATVLFFFSVIVYDQGRTMLVHSFHFAISEFEKKIDKDITEIENNAIDLALMGDVFLKTDRNKNIAEFFVERIFKRNYKQSLGGGIWFKPYSIAANKKFYCVYAYRDKKGKIILDRSYENENYNYLNQNWYLEIMPRLTKNHNVAWAKPYHEKIGSNAVMVTAGSGIYDNNELVGLATSDWELGSIVKLVRDIHPTPNSFVLFADKLNDYVIVSTDKYLDNPALSGKPLSYIPWYNGNLKDCGFFKYHNQTYVSYVTNMNNGMILIVNVPETEMLIVVTKHITMLFSMFLVIFALICFILYLVLRENIVRPIDKLIKIAKKISRGELDAEIKVEKPEEFVELANTFDKMTKDIKKQATEQEKIESELQIAQEIQLSALPNTFPAYPERNEFDIYASMLPAKVVGGDFYDFYFIDPNNFMFLVADVSGKGIPAALFMMTTKTMINNISQGGFKPKELIEKINRKVCQNNKQGFFVTMLMGIINIRTGKITLINCGHNPPLLKRRNGNFEYMDLPTNIVLGVYADFQFEIYEDKFYPNDKIFLYTDGVTEAVNAEDEQYGENTLQDTLNNFKNCDIKTIATQLKDSVSAFTSGAAQSDDITMLAFEYMGLSTKTYSNKATRENYSKFASWLQECFHITDLSEDLSYRIELCAEEIYTNIISYAYSDGFGDIEANFEKQDRQIILTFKDSGIQYNPLEKPDPDITLPSEKRSQGGLGIFMVKNSANETNYEYSGNKNILTLKFNL